MPRRHLSRQYGLPGAQGRFAAARVTQERPVFRLRSRETQERIFSSAALSCYDEYALYAPTKL